jgi:tetratricopeptide (TPR) repeat protein
MSLFNALSALALAPLLRPGAADGERERLRVLGRLAAHARSADAPLRQALERAGARAWQNLEDLLAGGGLAPGLGELPLYRAEAIDELRRVRQAGLLADAGHGEDFLSVLVELALAENDRALIEGAAGVLERSGCPRLASWFARPPQPGSPPLVVLVVRLHLEREAAWASLLDTIGSRPEPASWTGRRETEECGSEGAGFSEVAALIGLQPRSEPTPGGPLVVGAMPGAAREAPTPQPVTGAPLPEATLPPATLPVPASAPAPTHGSEPDQQAGPAPEQPFARDLRRRASIRWYRRMYPERMYPLTVVLARGRVKEVRVEGVAHATGTEQVEVPASHPFVVVRPVLPGIDCYPQQQTVDVTPELVTVRFRVVAKVLGRVADARIELYSRDRLLSQVPLDIKVSRQTVALVASAAGFAWPLLCAAAQKLGVEFEDSGDLLSRGLQAFFALPHAIETGFSGLLLVALGFYGWNRPRRAGADADVLSVRPLSLEELLAAGRLAAAKKEWEEAAGYFEDAVNVAPSNVAARAELAAVRVHVPGRASPPPSRPRTHPDPGEGSFKAYRAALEHGRWDEALKRLREAVLIDPERFEPFSFSRYAPERLLGAGGFGAVYLCRCSSTGRRVVIKALLSEGQARPAQDLFREAEALRGIDHPSILRVLDCGFAGAGEDRPYMVLDYFEGASLRDVVRARGPLAPGDYHRVATLLAEALQAAHERGVIHRDVKPANVLLRHGPAGVELKLIDFGIAVYPHEPGGTPIVRTTTARFGTPDYAAPEQVGALSGVRVDVHSDVYGFGRASYFALLGTPTPDDFEKRELPAEWQELLRDCTARTPQRRIKHFSTVLERLKAMTPRVARAN